MKLLFLFRRRRGTCALVLGLLFIFLLALGWFLAPRDFFRGYWFALMFWTQLSIGALLILLLQQLTGGEWGRVAAPLLRAGASGFFLLAVLFVPAFFALPHIFSWTKIEVGVSAPVLVHKELWLNSPAFIVRALIYLAAYGMLILLWQRRHPPRGAGPALVAVIVLFSFASADWMMSLQPTFYSSLYPFLYFSGTMVSTFALLSGTVATLQLQGRMPARPELLLAYGKLLFAAVLFWGYIAFSQFIIIWTGNLPDEAEWYVIRSEPAWLWLTVLVMAGHFALPFCLLLSQRIKQNPRQLLAISAALFGMHLVEVFWLMRPTPGEGFQLSIFDFVMPLLIGAGWLWFVCGRKEVGAWLDPMPKETHGEP